MFHPVKHFKLVSSFLVKVGISVSEKQGSQSFEEKLHIKKISKLNLKVVPNKF